MASGRILCSLGLLLVVIDAACTDEPNWTDSQNDNCSIYSASNWCTSDGLEGPDWNASLGNISSFASDGMDASQACCACGREATSPSPSPSPSPSVSPTPSSSPSPSPSPDLNGSLQGSLGISAVVLVVTLVLPG